MPSQGWLSLGAIKYSSKQIESTRTHLEVFAKHSREYRHGECEVCTHIATQSVLPSKLFADLQGKDLLRVPVTQSMVDLLFTIFDHTDDLRSATAIHIVRMWPAHYEQFGMFQTTMSKSDRAVLHITDVKVIRNRISPSTREKVLHSTAEDKVLQGQIAIKKNGMVAEANSAIVRLVAALQHVKGLARSLCKARQSLEKGWQDTSLGTATCVLLRSLL